MHFVLVDPSALLASLVTARYMGGPLTFLSSAMNSRSLRESSPAGDSSARATRLRVGIDARVLAEHAPKGVARYLRALLRATAELAPQHEYFLYLRQTPLTEAPFTTAPFRQLVLPGNVVLNSPLIWQQLYFPWQAWRNGMNVLVSPYYCGPLFTSVPHVVCICDISFSLFPQDFPSWIHFKPKLLARPSSRMATRVMTISEFSRQEILREYRLAPEKVIAIHAGTEERYWRREHAGAENPDCLVDSPFFLFVGSLLPRRQIDMVIRALSQLPTYYQLIVVGETDPAKREALLALARQWQVASRVIWLGHVSDETLENLYQQAIALVSPSIYEGLGLPVLEAMQRGVPVIAWDIPVVREVAGEAAVLLPCGDLEQLTNAMRKVGEDEAFRLSLTEKGRAWIQQFSWQQAAATFLTLLLDASGQP